MQSFCYQFLLECIALVVMYMAFRILQGDYLLNLFDIKNGTFFAKIVLLSFIGSIVSFPFSPLLLYLSRRYEKEADRFSCELTHSTDGITPGEMMCPLKFLERETGLWVNPSVETDWN